jgi:hypothetical protein
MMKPITYSNFSLDLKNRASRFPISQIVSAKDSIPVGSRPFLQRNLS